jgi:hypothetical protein
VKASFSKLKRDFERAHNTYQSVVANYHAKQKAEAALLSSKSDPSLTHGHKNRERHRPPSRLIIEEVSLRTVSYYTPFFAIISDQCFEFFLGARGFL